MLAVTATVIPDVLEVVPRRHEDGRGWLAETWNRARFASHGMAVTFVQDNLVRTGEAGTLRGLHFQVPPRAQGKLLSVLSGAVLDVAVDLRRGSPHFGRHVAVTLSAAAGNALWIPPGFAHGYCTLERDCLVAYKVTDYWSPEHERGLAWDDPALGIAWPADPAVQVIERDRQWPRLEALDNPFVHLSAGGPAR